MKRVSLPYKGIVCSLGAVVALLSQAGDLPQIAAAEQKGTRWVILDPAKTEGCVWEWRPGNDSNIRSEHGPCFGNPSEVKPKPGGKLLVASSCCAFAKIDIATCRADFYGVAAEDNVHSVEELPDGRVAIAASDGCAVAVYDVKGHEFDPTNQTRVASTYLRDAHGVVWDAARNCLWAIGSDRLVKFSWNGRSLSEQTSWNLEGTGCGDCGHDLQLAADGIVWFTTRCGVCTYDSAKNEFKRIIPKANVKSLSFFEDGLLLTIPRERWWTDTLVYGKREITRAAARFYKARYLFKTELPPSGRVDGFNLPAGGLRLDPVHCLILQNFN